MPFRTVTYNLSAQGVWSTGEISSYDQKMKACQEAKVLLEQFDECAQRYHEHARSLARMMETTAISTYADLLARVDDTLIKCQKARDAIVRHADRHGCFYPD